jgi:hypothetical protein
MRTLSTVRGLVVVFELFSNCLRHASLRQRLLLLKGLLPKAWHPKTLLRDAFLLGGSQQA